MSAIGPTPEQARIAAQQTQPRIVQLWFALQPLKSTIAFMNTGAHPDDETSAMLAALAFRDGISLSYACANRGEGGQNDIGTETTENLGVLRTAEMEKACDVLAMRMYWLSQSADDSIFDFGFSKSGVETLKKWGRKRTLKRFVEIVRTERPDIICPTFLDIPGQHGHHRAMTEMAHLVMNAAADPTFPNVDLPIWQVKKLYLPAWSGAGQAYDDDLPPPPATLTIKAKGTDPVTGWSWEQIGQQSRAFHRTQGMGRWVAPGQERDWPLHLADSRVPGPDQTVFDGLPRQVSDLAEFTKAAELKDILDEAQVSIDRTFAAFPNTETMLATANTALRDIRRARLICPDSAKDEVLHRLARKESELSIVIRLSAGVQAAGGLKTAWLHPGQATEMTIEQRSGQAQSLSVEPILPNGWSLQNGNLSASAGAVQFNPYPDFYDPAAPTAPALAVEVTYDDLTSTTVQALQTPAVLLPSLSAALTPTHAVMNTAAKTRSLIVRLSDLYPATATASLDVPTEWTARRTDTGFCITAPQEVADGLYELPVMLDGIPAQSLHTSTHAHIAPRARVFAAELSLRVQNVHLPSGRIGYIGGGHDRVAYWLRSMGVDLTELTDADLTDRSRLDEFDSLVIGIFALKQRPKLQETMPLLHEWITAGGHLLTLYHRPWDNWDPENTPPKPLEIGQPSLRWRVTDENAKVTHLSPDHPLLNTPNTIGPQDWQGWHKERGLYFAKAWDPIYTPLLEMADPGEPPHQGALLSAKIGKGRHSHCALILHHQMEKLTPGAFRLMANLLHNPKE